MSQEPWPTYGMNNVRLPDHRWNERQGAQVRIIDTPFWDVKITQAGKYLMQNVRPGNAYHLFRNSFYNFQARLFYAILIKFAIEKNE
jgi:hypothetical protein